MGISMWQILIVLAIVLLLFGTKKLRNAGSDIGEAVKGFKKGISDNDDVKALSSDAQSQSSERSAEATFDDAVDSQNPVNSKAS